MDSDIPAADPCATLTTAANLKSDPRLSLTSASGSDPHSSVTSAPGSDHRSTTASAPGTDPRSSHTSTPGTDPGLFVPAQNPGNTLASTSQQYMESTGSFVVIKHCCGLK